MLLRPHGRATQFGQGGGPAQPETTWADDQLDQCPSWGDLPVEIGLCVFDYLHNHKDLLTASHICRHWRTIMIAFCQKPFDLSKELDQEDVKALEKVPFSRLVLKGCKLGDEAARSLALFAHVKQLDLADNFISAAGAQAIASGLLSSLTSLNLRDNGIEDEGAMAIGGGNLTSLKSLDLSKNNIGDSGAKAITLLRANVRHFIVHSMKLTRGAFTYIVS
jgi:Leucine-rich repeat (LRR) protein